MEIWMIVAFVAYFVVIIGVGMYFYNRSAKMHEYFLADSSSAERTPRSSKKF